MNKKAAIGESILMIYRLILISISCFIILGISATLYYYDINIRNIEAEIIGKNVVLCLTKDFMFDADKEITDEMKYSLLDYCGFKGSTERIFLKLEIIDSSGDEIASFYHGDSGAAWVRRISQEAFKKFEPGFFRENYKINLKRSDLIGIETDARIKVEVFVNADK